MLTVTDSVWYSLTARRIPSASISARPIGEWGKKQKLFSTPAINFIFAVDRRFQNTREHQQDLIAF